MTLRPTREKRNPVARKKARHSPPAQRSRAMHALSARAAQGRFVLQSCIDCDAKTYPPRDACPVCWGELAWRDCANGANVLCTTVIRATTDLFFGDHLPWYMGKVALDAGPVAMVHLHHRLQSGDRARVYMMTDRSGNAALFAVPDDGEIEMTDPQWREFVVPIQGKTALITDARGAIGAAVVRALHHAGCGLIVAGIEPPDRISDADNALFNLPGVQTVPFDITDSISVGEAMSKIGGPLDLVVNTARYVRSGGISKHANLNDQRRAFDVSAIGFSRLTSACAPMLAGRPNGAFVDVISSDAIVGSTDFAGFSAAEAARLSMQQMFRHEMRGHGVRVLSVFTGPVDDEHHQNVPPPKVAPDRVAASIVDALNHGREQTCVGDIATDAMDRWLSDPALFAREKNL